MSQASHAFKLLNRLYGLVLIRMRGRERTLAAPSPRWVGLEPLEPRILFSATPMLEELRTIGEALVGTPAVVVDRYEGTGTDETVDRSTTGDAHASPRRELVIVDSGTPDYQQLVDDLRSGSDESRQLEVVVLDGDRDGVEQIGELLGAYRDLDAIHIISHGDDGGLQLGSQWLSVDTVADYANQLTGWGDALTAEADLLVYGCNLAATESGQALVETLALLTGADVAASTDLTGKAELGGDWELEYVTGEIEASVALGSEARSTWSSTLEADAASQYVALPLAFEENVGQSDEAVDFLARGSGYTVFLSDGDAVIALDSGEGAYALRLDLVGANDDPTVTGGDPVPGSSNYLVGDGADGHQAGVSHVGSVVYENVYDGIDVRYYGNQRQLEYDFIVAAGADPGMIAIDFQGAQSVHVDESGELVVRLWAGEEDIHFKAPYAYQDTEAGRVEVSSRYVLTVDGQVGFELGAYDDSLELVIDPILDYSTYLGGTGADQAYEVTVDGAGAIYLLGKTQSVDFPVGAGSLSGTSDVFVAKLQPDGNGGSDLVFATYIGGSGNEYGSGNIEVDGAGNIIILGSTDSTDFATTAGAYDTSFNGGSDAFVVKLNAAGDTLLYSTYFGGSAGESGNDLALDGAGNVYITGQTLSNDLSLVNAYDSSFTGGSEAFVAKLNLAGGGASDLVYATYLGGSSDYESGMAIAVDGAGIIYVGAKGLSADHPTTAGAYQTSQSGSSDAVLALLDPSLSGSSQLVYGTFLGGSGSESINAIHLDGSGVVYLVGNTNSTDLPATAGAFQTTHGGGWDMYLAKLNPLGGGASDLVYATYLGGTGYETANDVHVDGNGIVYIVGTGEDGAPTAYPVQGAYGGGTRDAYVAMLDLAGGGSSDLLFGSYLGGADTDYGYGLAVDVSGNIYVAGYTQSGDLPTTSGAYSETNAGGAGTSDAFVAKLTGIANDYAPVITPGQSLAVPESAGNGTVVGTVVATDADPIGSLQDWTIVSGNGDGIFQINSNTGEITIADNTNLDFETTSSYVLGVQVSDGPHNSSVENVTINVTDVAAVFTVTTTADSGAGSLRQAILDANVATENAVINFNIGTGAQTINLSSALPVLNQQMTIDGTSQPGYSGTPLIQIDGTSAGAGVTGLEIAGGGTTVKGLIISDFGGNGILVHTNGGNVIQGNYIGTNAAGTAAAGNGGYGVEVLDVGNNTIGGSNPGEGNVISGNDQTGVTFWGSGATNNSVLGNFIGTSASGTAAVGNLDDGIRMGGGASSNTIGGTTAAERNVISGNGEDGIELLNAGTVSNQIFGNHIGTNAAGTAAIGNARYGIVLYDEVANTTIGGTAAGAGNLISGNASDGVMIDGNGQATTTGNVLQGNFIGTDVTGTSAIANGDEGVEIKNGAVGNTVGGGVAGARNIISGNVGDGVALRYAGTDSNSVVGNFIGTDVNGTSGLGNGAIGIRIEDGANNTIGGTGALEGNVIGDSGDHGVYLTGSGTTGNTIQGNFIGTDTGGTIDLGNALAGIRTYDGAANNTFGGTAAGAGNVIAYNSGAGVALKSTGDDGNAINRNRIYANGGLGIDLGEDGVTLNDTGSPHDVDTVANQGQNYPVLSTAVTDGVGTITIDGTLNSTAGTAFRIEFFASSTPDGSGYGEGETYLGFVNVVTDGSGDASFSAGLSAVVAPGQHISATATDPSGNTSEFGFAITAVGNNPPVVTPGQSFNVPESATNGTSVGTVAGSDPDTDPLSGWTIVSGNGDGIFQINSSTGEITIVDDTNLDREVTGSYVLGIQVGDGVNTSVTETVAITVTDVNDTAPVVTASQSFNVSEGAGNGSSVGTVLATDADTTGSLTGWSIVSGNGDGVFQINGTTGEITIADNANLDREITGSYVLGIEVGDGVTTSVTETVAITVTDVNDTAPVVTASQGFNVSEAAGNGVSVGTVLATDADTTGSLTGWTIVSGNGDGIFQINGTTGEITIADNTNLDREVTGSYVLGVQVGDGVNTSVTETVAITVADVNDTAPMVTASQSFNVSEGAGNGVSVGTVLATDADTTGSLTGWTIVSGNGDGVFQINGTTGEITIADNTNLDREITGSYVLGIEVGDGVNTSVTETVAITVIDVNDTAPVVTASQSFNVSEGAGNGVSVGTVLATDADTTGSLTGWTIVSGNTDGIFQINSSTGEITVLDNTNLDREVTGSYVLGIEVGDGVNTSVTETVAITVTDVNDTAPVVTASQSFNVSEGAGNGVSVGTVLATDADTTGSLTGWTIVSGNTDGIFQINGATGEITVLDNTNLDRELAGSYVLGIEVGDGVTTSTTETVAITVTDVNDTAPVVTASQSFNVSEGAGNGVSVGTVLATDADTTGSLTGWTIVSGNTDGIFQINSSTGEITVLDNTNLDRELAGSCVLGIEVGDGVNTSATETVAITVTDVNDTAPVITASQGFNVSEAAGNGVSVGTVLATDADTTGSLTGWTIVSGNGDGIFQINSTTGEITIADNTNLDREVTGSYVLGIEVGDGVNTSVTETVAITVTDVNDTAPVITASQGFNVSEAAGNGSSVGTVLATDADTTGSLTGWTITSGNGDGIFQINGTTGEITVLDNTNLDRELAGSYVLGIEVGDGVNTSATETVAITVTDVNDTAPVVTASQSFNVSEGAGNGVSVGTVLATDADTTGSLTGWTIVSGNTDGIFQINSTTGEITVLDNTNLDRELTGSYVLGIEVGDGVNTSATETVAITVTDVNDTAPVVTASQSFNVFEGAGNGVSVGTVLATDADTTGSLTGWTIVSGNTDGIFQINGATGEITVLDNTNLDRELTGSYVLGIEVGDGVNTSATETVAITVTDVNDTAPVVTASQSFNVSEGAGNGVSVGTVLATDADTTGSLTGWTIVSGNTDGIFQISGTTGEITIADNTNLDREVTGSYVLGIQVGDGVNTSVTETVAITVTDVNDTAPVVTASQSFNVSEGAGNGVSVGTVLATDADTTGSLTGWTIVSGNTDGIFQINGTTGEITVLDNTNLDRELAGSYVLGIEVGDGVTASTTETVAITVTDVNDTAPVVTASQSFNVSEGAGNGVSVGTVLATDADTTGSLTGWTIVSGNTDGIFQINSSTGEITVLDNTNLDRELAGSYVLGIEVGDGVNTSATETVAITVTDVNDTAPVVTASQSFNVSEGAGNGVSVGTVLATDADTTGSLTGWTIVSGNTDGIFQINSTTGEITVLDNTNLDRELTGSYVLGIEVGDGVNTSATETVAITVTDVNDTAPVVTTSQSFNVSEGAGTGVSVGTVLATDADTTGSLTGWTIVSGNTDGIFQINSTTGEITVLDNTNLDRELTGSYVLGIEVGDGVNTSATETVAITVTDVNDTAPVVTASQSFNVSEGAGTGVSVGTVLATDADTTGSLTGWTIVSGNTDGIFQINSTTGEITVLDNTNLDRELTGSYVLGIEVGDGVNTSATETVAITVTDVNDTAPVVTASQSFNVSEGAGNGVSVGTVLATDADTTGSLTGWTIVSGNTDGIFQINSTTGEITVLDNTNLDRELTGSYVLGIEVGDGVNTSATETVAITVTDVNDTAPVVTASQSFNVSEGAGNGVSVGTVLATDADTTGSLTGWTIVSGNTDGIFQINGTTGEITVLDNTNLDRELTGSYVLGIEVGDGVTTSTTETVAITVTDVNDTAPVVTASQSFNVSEGAGNGVSVGTVLATDADTTGSLTGWTIVSGNTDGIFQINSSTGEITVVDNTNLDYESATSYALGIQVGDGVNTSATETVTINVTDVNDVTPTITASQSFNIGEDAANTDPVGTVLASDPDTVGSLQSWAIVSGNGDGTFQINGSTGEITVLDNTNLNYESATSYVLGIQVGDGLNTSATETVTINVTDVNDVTPTITASQSFNIGEDAANSDPVGTVLASDSDTVGSLQSWAIVSGNGDGIFQINGSTGEITVLDNTNLDYESATSYALGIQVGDGVNTSATETVTINVTDVNDVTPTITASQSFNIGEDAANSDPVGTVLASDPDTVGSLTGWTIVSGNTDGIFQINGSTGEITVLDNTNLDYESATSYALGIQVGDGVNTSATETVTINVTDVNDVTPTITASQSFNIGEDAANTDPVGTVLASDPDTVGSLQSWTIVSGNGDGIFQINSSTGEITVLDNTNLDYESATSYVLGIQVGDGVNTSATETVTINVADVNDVTPTITASQSFNIGEDAANTDPVGTVLASDPDTVGSLQSWAIVSGNGDGIFQINGSTGEITVLDNTNLDYESATSYALGIQVGDGVNTSAIETVTINVTDVNDVTPTITASQSFNIGEDAANTDPVGTVLASDADTVGSLQSWAIVSGNVDGIFQINSSTGEITIADNTNLDYEATNSYVLGIQVGDGANTSATETVTINVTDVNDVTPTITASQSFNIGEDAANTDPVGTVLASDADTVGSLQNWTIVSGNGDGIFQINGSTGEITIADNTNLDYEAASSYVLGIQVGDGVNTSATETVAITVTDVNDTAPVITPSQSFSVSEAATNGTSTGSVLATDADTTGSLTGWTIVSGNGDGIFQINGTTGEITIADNANLDHEATSSYVLGIQVGDGVNTSVIENVTINVTDVNETPTVTPIADVTANEDAAPIVIDLFAAFEDAEDGDGAMLYDVLSNTNGALFGSVTIDGGLGTLTLDPSPDQFGTADLTIRATDTGAQTVQTTFTVTINAVNDAPVVSANTGAAVDQGEQVQVTSSVLQAGDVDNTASEIEFTMTAGPAHGNLTLDGVALEDGDTFTQQDIDDARIAYVHDGSLSGQDSITLRVEDGAGGVINATVSMIDVNVTAPVLPPDGGSTPEPVAEGNANPGNGSDPASALEEATETPSEQTEPKEESGSPTDDAAAAQSEESAASPVAFRQSLGTTPGDQRHGGRTGQVDQLPSAQMQMSSSYSTETAATAPTEQSLSEAVAIARRTLPVLTRTAMAQLSPDVILEQITQAADQVRGTLDANSRTVAVSFGSAAGVTGAVAVGYTVWAVRGGSLLASVLSSLPMWTMLDPLPVLDQSSASKPKRRGPNTQADDDGEELLRRVLD